MHDKPKQHKSMAHASTYDIKNVTKTEARTSVWPTCRTYCLPDIPIKFQFSDISCKHQLAIMPCVTTMLSEA